MSFWCTCRMMPACEYRWCDQPAELSALVPASWTLPLRFAAKFFCVACWENFAAAWKAPIRGVDRPEHAPEDWCPSLDEMMRHAKIAFDFENRNKKAAVQIRPAINHLDAYWKKYETDRGFTQAQRESAARHRELCRKYALSSTHLGAPK